MANERSEIPEGIDPDESPFELQAIEGLPFAKDGVEAKAIREVLSGVDGEGAGASPWALPPIDGLPFGKNSDDTRAAERVIEQAEKEQDTTAS